MIGAKYKTIVLVILAVIIQSCKNKNSIDFVGFYEIDKNVKRNQSDKTLTHNFLIIKSNNTFKLCNINDSNSIIGHWEIIKFERNNTAIIQFTFNNNVIRGKLNDTILTFEYPNDFYSGLYEILIYVKLSKEPERLKD